MLGVECLEGPCTARAVPAEAEAQTTLDGIQGLETAGPACRCPPCTALRERAGMVWSW